MTTAHNIKKSVINKLLPAKYQSFGLVEFLERHTALDLTLDDTTFLDRQLLQTVIVPLETWPLQPNKDGSKRQPQNFEPISSVVDHAVWTLVERRERLRQQRQGSNKQQKLNTYEGRNVLSQGYTLASSNHAERGAQPVRTMPAPGVVLLKLNSNVEFIKTSDWGRRLHNLVGDDTLRALLLYACIFVPIFSGENGNIDRSNFLHLVGPPLTTSSVNIQEHQSRRRRRKRKRSVDVADFQRESNHEVALQGWVSNRGLFSPSQNQVFVPSPGLPSNHILNQSPTEPPKLAEYILGKGSHSNPSKLCKRLGITGLFAICESIIKRHRKCDYARLLQRFCPLPLYVSSGTNKNKADSSEVDLAQVSGDFSPPEQVISFSKSVAARLFPEELWGCQHNLSMVLQHIESFIKLRRQESLSVKLLMNGIKINKIRWLFGNRGKRQVSAKEHEEARYALSRVLRWVLEDFLSPLLRSCFHATESEFGGRQVLFYRKPVWSLFTSLSMKKLTVSKEQYRSLSLEEVSMRLDRQEMGLSRLRLLPKSTGVRPIAILSAPANVRKRHFDGKVMCVDDQNQDKATRKKQKVKAQLETTAAKAFRVSVQSERKPSSNSALNDAFAVLRHHHKMEPDIFGSGVAGLHFFYPRYKHFLAEAQKRQDSKKFYFASVDIKACYDSINQEELLRLVGQFVEQEDYVVQRVGVFHSANTNVKSIHREHVEVEPPESLKPLSEVVKTMNSQYHGAIFRDTVNNAVVNKNRLLSQIAEHMKSHLVVWKGRFREQFLVQSKGIPQGSILSSLLCNAYYGSVVEKRLGLDQIQLHRSDDLNLLSRMMDDYLLISDSLQRIQQFVYTMDKGAPELGATINRDKTQVSCNLSFQRDGGEPVSLKARDTKTHFPWCGMLFDTRTGEVRIDYSRFYDGKAGHGLTVYSSNREGHQLASQMKLYVRPRCLPILFDPTINSFKVLCVNLYQLFMMGAVKLAFHLKTCKRMGIEISNTDFLIQCIESTISFALGLVRSRLDYNSIHFSLRHDVCQMLSWHAFQDVFVRLIDFSTLSNSLTSRCGSFKSIRDREILEIHMKQARREVDICRLLDDTMH